jgi:hypothetical protein
MNLSQVDRSTGWFGIVIGAILLAWSPPTLWSFASTGSGQFVIRYVLLGGASAILAAGLLAACGIVLVVAGIAVLVNNRA